MKNILLAGPTGNLGPHLIKAFIEKNYQVYALIRPESINNPDKVAPLKALGVNLVEGDVNDKGGLEEICQGMDVVVSALGGGQLMQQESLLEASQKTGVKRFIPSEFGVNPYASERGTCDLFDAKHAIQQKIKASGMPYTMIYSNGFMEFWASGLGQLGNSATTGQVSVFGNGQVKAAMTALPDIARFTAEMIADPEMENKEVSISANIMTQDELIHTWEQLSGATIKRNVVSDEELLNTINNAKIPEEMMIRVFTQLHRSVWIKGDTSKNVSGIVEATEAYPDIPVTSVEAFFSYMLKPAD
jgi:uncharacterized protein YbjT (DUF2867 family)